MLALFAFGAQSQPAMAATTLDHAQVTLAVNHTLPGGVSHANVLLGSRAWQMPQNLAALSGWQEKVYSLCTKYGLIQNNTFNWRYFWNSIFVLSLDDIFFVLVGAYTLKKSQAAGGEQVKKDKNK